MREENVLFIEDGIVKLIGFSKLNKNVNFCFRKSGIVITSKECLSSQCFLHNATNGVIESKKLSDMLLERGLSEKNQFVYLSGNYFELTPHAIKDSINEDLPYKRQNAFCTLL